MVLLHENEKEIYGDIPARCLDIVESVGSPNLRLAWDAGQLRPGRGPPVHRGLRAAAPASGVHADQGRARWPTGEVVPPVRGDGEMLETIRALRDDGFDGFFSLEPHLATTTRSAASPGPSCSPGAAAFTGLPPHEGIEYA